MIPYTYTEWKPYKGTWYRAAVKYESSPKEKELQREFVAKKVRYTREVQFKGLKTPNEGWYRADFFLPDKDMIVEYDGLYHLTDEQKKIDAIKDEYYKSIGLTVIRVNKDNYNKQLRKIFNVKLKGKKGKRKNKEKINSYELAKLLGEAKRLASINDIDHFIRLVKEINRNK